MKKTLHTITFLCAFVCIGAFSSLAQVKDIGIIFNKRGFIQEINLKTKELVINYVTESSITEEVLKLNNPKLVIQGGNNINAADKLRVGMEVTVDGELFQSGNYGIAGKISVAAIDKQTKPISKGRIDGIKGEFAYIDGNKIKMNQGKGIAGANGYKGHNFDAFTSLKLGDIASLNGNYDYNGFYAASDMQVEPDIETELDKQAKAPINALHDAMYDKWMDPKARSSFFGQPLPDGNVLPSQVMQEYVNKVGLRLVPDNMKDKLKFMFVVNDDEHFNACVYPNGFSMVNAGLFDYVHNEAQLAAVLGHEIAHAMYEHGAKKMADDAKAEKKKRLFGSIADAAKKVNQQINPTVHVKYGSTTESSKVSDSFYDMAIKDLPASYIDKMNNQYSIEEETQADRVGLYLMVQAGYDPREAAKIWKEVYNASRAYKDEAQKKESATQSGTTTAEKKTGVIAIVSSAINSGVKGTINRNKVKSSNDHPDDVKRFEDLNRLVALYWSDNSILDNADNGELVFSSTLKKVVQELGAQAKK